MIVWTPQRRHSNHDDTRHIQRHRRSHTNEQQSACVCGHSFLFDFVRLICALHSDIGETRSVCYVMGASVVHFRLSSNWEFSWTLLPSSLQPYKTTDCTPHQSWPCRWTYNLHYVGQLNWPHTWPMNFRALESRRWVTLPNFHREEYITPAVPDLLFLRWHSIELFIYDGIWFQQSWLRQTCFRLRALRKQLLCQFSSLCRPRLIEWRIHALKCLCAIAQHKVDVSEYEVWCIRPERSARKGNLRAEDSWIGENENAT